MKTTEERQHVSSTCASGYLELGHWASRIRDRQVHFWLGESVDDLTLHLSTHEAHFFSAPLHKKHQSILELARHSILPRRCGER